MIALNVWPHTDCVGDTIISLDHNTRFGQCTLSLIVLKIPENTYHRQQYISTRYLFIKPTSSFLGKNAKMLKNGSGTPQSAPEAEMAVSEAELRNSYGKHCSRTSALLRYHQAASENRQNLEGCLNDLHDVCSHLEKRIKGICETYDGEKSQLQQEIAQCEDKNDHLEAILANLREENRVAEGLIATQSRVIDTLQAQHHPGLQNMNGLAQHGLMLSDCVETSGQYGP